MERLTSWNDHSLEQFFAYSWILSVYLLMYDVCKNVSKYHCRLLSFLKIGYIFEGIYYIYI